MPLPLGEVILPADLEGTVIADEPCPPIPSGPGRVVLAAVSHLAANVFELTLADEQAREERVRPSGNHPFYSVDRSQWIAVEDLRAGNICKAFTAV